MRSDIVEKLNREFDQDIVSERQVVYILVEVRKLLEQENVLDNFRAFKLCSDWVVHPKLDRTGAQFVLRYFNEYEDEFQRSGVTVAESKLAELKGFLTHERFRDQFIEALEPRGVRTEGLKSDAYWREFIQHYSAVVQDCPLEAKANTTNTRYVNAVTCLAWPKEQAKIVYPGKRVVQWSWKLKNGTRETKRVCAFI